MKEKDIDEIAKSLDSLIDVKALDIAKSWLYVCNFTKFLYSRPFLDGKLRPRHKRVSEIEEVQAGIKAAFRFLTEDAGYFGFFSERYSTEWNIFKKKGYLHGYQLALFGSSLLYETLGNKKFTEGCLDNFLLAHIPHLFTCSLKPLDNIEIGMGAFLPISLYRNEPPKYQTEYVKKNCNNILFNRVIYRADNEKNCTIPFLGEAFPEE